MAALGEVLGRLITSYVVVLAILLLVNKFKGNVALTKSKKWYSVAGTIFLFVVGLAVTTSQSGAI